jgi:catechol 2,3-dioxygenase-like lactoylglutathione lyase family enzyme
MESIRNVDYTILICADLPRTMAFYRDVMQFPVEIENASWVNFHLGSSILALRTRSVDGGFEDGSCESGSASVQLAFRVPASKLDDCYRELLRQQVTIVRTPTELPDWGHRMFLFRDPEGNLLEIFAEI